MSATNQFLLFALSILIPGFNYFVLVFIDKADEGLKTIIEWVTLLINLALIVVFSYVVIKATEQNCAVYGNPYEKVYVFEQRENSTIMVIDSIARNTKELK